ncbi:hypothetical protein PI87_16515 [Ralstonia sp. A12]|uniref:hypothetical protein n=1 Tax=Ralstonia sp. A12 TaxID=1217052 RepID=UPI0005759AEC|nr:hypothetical protein [Ralstonia sp. A12]KHK54117.1 hypothetical protein PI87_16515 [Ralstonia sp. A12]
MARDPKSVARIQAIKVELLRMKPASNVGDAWQSIFNAVACAEAQQPKSDRWTIEPLSAPTITRYGDETVRVPLIAHWIYLNRNGAIRIVDLWETDDSAAPFFELHGADGKPFAKPPSAP